MLQSLKEPNKNTNLSRLMPPSLFFFGKDPALTLLSPCLCLQEHCTCIATKNAETVIIHAFFSDLQFGKTPFHLTLSGLRTKLSPPYPRILFYSLPASTMEIVVANHRTSLFFAGFSFDVSNCLLSSRRQQLVWRKTFGFSLRRWQRI
jgi:hypothetical protein